jgi:hypothetical protein
MCQGLVRELELDVEVEVVDALKRLLASHGRGAEQCRAQASDWRRWAVAWPPARRPLRTYFALSSLYAAGTLRPLWTQPNRA